MADKKVKPTYMTHIVTASWPKLHEADFKYKTDVGEFGVKALLDPSDPKDQALMDHLDALADAALEEMKTDEKTKKFARVMKRADMYAEELTKGGEPTGKIVVNFTCPAKFIRKADGMEWPNRPILIDAQLTPLAASVKIGGGSRIKIKYESEPYFNATEKKAGATKRLLAVQLITLKTWDRSADIESLGFEIEDGYSGTDAPEDGTEEQAPQSAASKATPASDF